MVTVPLFFLGFNRPAAIISVTYSVNVFTCVLIGMSHSLYSLWNTFASAGSKATTVLYLDKISAAFFIVSLVSSAAPTSVSSVYPLSGSSKSTVKTIPAFFSSLIAFTPACGILYRVSIPRKSKISDVSGRDAISFTKSVSITVVP